MPLAERDWKDYDLGQIRTIFTSQPHPGIIGKPAGNDLRQGMVTLPLIYALQEQPHNGLYQKVQPLLNGAVHQEEDIQAVISQVTEGHGIKQALADAQTYAQKAREALYNFPPSSNRAVLDELIDFVVSRKN